MNACVKYIVPSRKHTALREAYLYTHQRLRVDLSPPISPAHHPRQLLEARIEALRGPTEPVYVALSLRILLGHNYPPAWGKRLPDDLVSDMGISVR